VFKKYEKSHFCVWIRIHSDPHAKARGFSIKNRELKVKGFEPVVDEMEDLAGNKMRGTFWIVAAEHVYQAIPELRRFPLNQRDWFFPIEFCEPFIRPAYYDPKILRDVKLS
jgi:hypothetical protein